MLGAGASGFGLFTVTLALDVPAQADSADLWWDEAWPYRIPISASGSGVAEVAIDDADAPQIGFHLTDVYWTVNDGSLAAESASGRPPSVPSPWARP